MTKTYLIHDNGGRPFKVVINDNVSVYNENGYNEQTDEIIYSKEPIINLKGISNIFIGKSPENEMTKFSGGYGPNFDGNSILVHIKDNEYIYIGSEIFRFHSFAEIIDYKSPVGNSDVPYPYAIDKENNYYLMIESVVINKNSNILDDPYYYYYNLELFIPKKINGQKIKDFYIGDKKYDFSYTPTPHKKYDWISSWEDFGDGMKFILDNNKEHKIDRKEYIKIIKKIGIDNNIKHLQGYPFEFE